MVEWRVGQTVPGWGSTWKATDFFHQVKVGEGYLLGSDGSELCPSSSLLSATSCAICARVVVSPVYRGGGVLQSVDLCVEVCQAGRADCLSPLPSQFCGAIVLIFFLELAVAVLAFLFQDWVRDRFREFFESNIRSYRDDIDLQNLIDSLQKAVSSAPDRPPLTGLPLEPALSHLCIVWDALQLRWNKAFPLQSGFSATAWHGSMEHAPGLWSASLCSAAGVAVRAPSDNSVSHPFLFGPVFPSLSW